jgi:tRNA(fMet)-specific endonuclease VapC
MTRYLLDTNALAHCIFRRKGVEGRFREVRRRGIVVGTAMPALAEVLAGIEFSESRERNLDVFNRTVRQFRLWPFDLPAVREYARIYAELRRKGAPVQNADMMIAGTARSLVGCRVVTSDSDFERIDGLVVENWESE